MNTETLYTDHAIEDHVMSNDDAMDAFRSKFPLVHGCYVSDDGNTMTFEFKSLTQAYKFLHEAQTIISFLKLPLKSVVKNTKLGGVVMSSYLHIVYNPNKA